MKSRAEYDSMYARSLADPQGFWGDLAKQFHWCVLALLLLRQRPPPARGSYGMKC